MNKLIFRASLIGLVISALAALLVFSLWILCAPQTMATACERTGNYLFAVTCADLRYKYTNDVNDLARCAEDGILSGKDEFVITYGEKLVSDENYDALCAQKDEALAGGNYNTYRTINYNSYICGHLAAAQYRSGNLDKAVQTAINGGVQSFSKLAIEIAEKADGQAAQTVIDVLEEQFGATEEVTVITDLLKKYI